MVHDVVYVLGNGSRWKNNEIRYSIRSLQKHCLDLGRIFIVGNQVEFLHGIESIELPDPYEEKEKNTLFKTIQACKSDALSERFMKVDDDFFFLKPFKIAHVKPLVKGEITDVLTRLNPFKRYTKVVGNTLEYLTGKGLPIRDYEVHNPVVYDKGKFIEIMSGMLSDQSKPVCMKSIYFNSLTNTEAINGKDMKINIPLQLRQIEKELSGAASFSVGDIGLTPIMRDFICRMFPQASMYEVQAQAATSPEQTPASLQG